ncbi:RDD family protein [Paenibacillus ihbetae]|uniref:RDD family protein n=1 Tax=Paenibacillus ihbetae TaxID=1870820 RepID=UPI001CB8FF18|nr:RDD family protein [Paenibacillus ihbetae]
MFGFIIAPVILALFPSRRNLIAKAEKMQESPIVPPLPQLLAVLVDYLLIKISWTLTVGFFITTSEVVEFLYTTIIFVILFAVVPFFWDGKTIGTHLLRFNLTTLDGGTPSWPSLLKRSFALYLPLAASWLLSFLNGIELDMDSKLYPYHVWISVAAIAFLFMMWVILVMHVTVVLFKKGKRNFYFDDVANLVPRKNNA